MQKRRGATQAEVPAASSLRSTMTSTPFSRARDQLGDAQLVELYRQMMLIRRFEEKCHRQA